MKKRKFARTDLPVSELCLNTTALGWGQDESLSMVLLDAYHAAGGGFIQSFGTAARSSSAPSVENGSEDLVGCWRETRGVNRDSLVLASRMNFVRPTHGGSIAFVNLIRESCERSLRRLRTKHLDMLICEWDDQLAPVDDVIEAVDMLIRAGYVRYAVAGGFPPWRLVDSIHRASLRNHARFEGLQAEYSLMTRIRFEPEALALCRDHRLGFLARSPLAGGFLARRPLSVRELINVDRNWQHERFGSNRGDAVLRVLGDIADRRRIVPAQVALAWVLRNPQVTSAVVSPSTPEELRELIRATELVLTSEETDALLNATAAPDHRMELRHL